MAKVRALIVEDEELLRTGLAAFLRVNGFIVEEAGSVTSAREKFASFHPDIVLLDYLLPEGTALDVLPDFRESAPSMPIVVLTGHGTIDLAVSAVKLGADQFLLKPVEFDSLILVLQRALANQSYRRRAAAGTRREGYDPFLGSTSLIRTLAEEAHKVADADTPVLILGETGTGKGVMARWLHENSQRRDEPFVDTNCAGFAPELLDTELFGHERGAFTGAVATKQGLVEVAHRGVLFLDEIGDMSVQTQPKLLKIIEDQRFRRIGSVRDRLVDVRIIAATNRDLAAAVADGQFRSDLYYRINMIPLLIPPLRDRPDDIVVLAREILTRIATRYRHKIITLTEKAVQALRSYPWPGNVRELRNVLERTMLLTGRDTIDAPDLRLPNYTNGDDNLDSENGRRTLVEVEKHHIERTLTSNQGNVMRTAKALGISRTAFYGKLKKHRIPLATERKDSARPSNGTPHANND